jgi:DNA (cytosine-5)-methyltransferase 1
MLMQAKPKALDLFSGAGGAAMGLYQAGFEVVGVDISPQPHFPFTFFQADAMAFSLWGFDFIWASPPCQKHSRLNGINQKEYADFIGPIRQRLIRHGIPFVLENVVGAPLIDPVTLCGSMFGCGVWRHRLFEAHGFDIPALECQHAKVPYPIDVTGTGGPCKHRQTAGGGLHRKPKSMAQASEVMGIDWMTRKEIVQAIPPAYAKHIGTAALARIRQIQDVGPCV